MIIQNSYSNIKIFDKARLANFDWKNINSLEYLNDNIGNYLKQ